MSDDIKTPPGETSARLEILKGSLKKKEQLFDQRLAAHFNDVKSANGQPLNDKSNGRATVGRWDRQSDALRAMNLGIEKTKQAIERESQKIAHVNATDIPDFLREMISAGELTQWRKHPNTFFVSGVDKGRIVWDGENKTLSYRYLSSITKAQYPSFRDAFNKANAAVRALRAAAATESPAGAIGGPHGL